MAVTTPRTFTPPEFKVTVEDTVRIPVTLAFPLTRSAVVPVPVIVTSPEVFQDGPPVESFAGVTVPSPGTLTGTAGPKDTIEQSNPAIGAVMKVILEPETV